MDMIRSLAELENNNDLHVARLLLLISTFKDEHGTPRIVGLMKLAKLDFLLRYPIMLRRALEAKGAATALRVEPHEEVSVESSMVRYRYGPWDHRYRKFISVMVARGLAKRGLAGNAMSITLTPKGLGLAQAIALREEFKDLAKRSAIIEKHFDQKGNHLKRFMYQTFPELLSMRFNEVIGP